MSAEADSKRYRFLRDQAAELYREGKSVPYVLAGNNFPELDQRLAGDAMDEAIDLAIRKTILDELAAEAQELWLGY